MNQYNSNIENSITHLFRQDWNNDRLLKSSRTHSLSLSSQTHTYTLYLSLKYTHTHSLSLSPLKRTLTHYISHSNTHTYTPSQIHTVVLSWKHTKAYTHTLSHSLSLTHSNTHSLSYRIDVDKCSLISTILKIDRCLYLSLLVWHNFKTMKVKCEKNVSKLYFAHIRILCLI